MDLQPKDDPPKPSVKPSPMHQNFLLNFIMGNYLGPDIKFDKLGYLAYQRKPEGSPLYESSDLGASYVSGSLLESLYYYILRNADPSLVLKPNMLHKYLKGSLPLSSSGSRKESWQFPDIFPLNLHQQIWYPESFKIFKGIVFIDDPVTSYMKEDDLEMFRSLSGMDNLKLYIDESRKYRQEYQNTGKLEHHLCEDTNEAGNISNGNGNGNSSDRFQQKYKRRWLSHPLLVPPVVTTSEDSKHCGKDGPSWNTCKPEVPVLMPLLSVPKMEACVSDPSIVLSGTVKRGVIGPPIGTADIGISKVAYYFRISLPGIKKDFCQFSCEIEPNGKVHLQGFTSGGNPIKKRSHVFKLKLQQLCPPGPFTLSFSLPDLLIQDSLHLTSERMAFLKE